MAKEKTNPTPEETENTPAPEKTAPKIDPMEELVPYKAFYDGDKYKDDIYVCVNGERLQIRRGEEVMIKRKFVEVLEASEKQDGLTAAMVARRARAFEAETKALGI